METSKSLAQKLRAIIIEDGCRVVTAALGLPVKFDITHADGFMTTHDVTGFHSETTASFRITDGQKRWRVTVEQV
jgi:hypothetical protein